MSDMVHSAPMGERSRPPRQARTKRLRHAALPFIGPLALIIGWILGARMLNSPYMPPLTDVLQAFADNWLFARFGSDVVPSMQRLSLGYFLGVLVGVLVGGLLGFSTFLRTTCEALVEFLRALPKIAVMPVFFVLVGIGDTSKILIIATAAAVPVLLSTMDGFRSTEPELIAACRVFGVPRFQGDFLVRLRWATPQIFAGARTSLALAFVMMIISEMYGSTNGIGYYTLIAQQGLEISGMWSGILLLGILGLLFNAVFVLVERLSLSWYLGSRQAESRGH